MIKKLFAKLFGNNTAAAPAAAAAGATSTPAAAPAEPVRSAAVDANAPAYASFGLHPNVMRGIVDAGFTHCTPIQARTLPFALAGRDVAGQAQTGTGKTAAFLVAMFQSLLTRLDRGERGRGIAFRRGGPVPDQADDRSGIVR